MGSSCGARSFGPERCAESTASSSKPEDDDLLSTDTEFNGILLWSQEQLQFHGPPQSSWCPTFPCGIMVQVPGLAWRDMQGDYSVQF